MDKRVTIRFFDSDINFIGEIDNYNTLIYISKWKTYGQFEIHTAIPNERLFQEGHLILLNNDPRKTGIIKYVKMDDKDGGEIQIKGFSLLYLLTQRITIPPAGRANHEFTNTPAEDIIISLVNYNAVSPVDGKRKMQHRYTYHRIQKNRRDHVKSLPLFSSLSFRTGRTTTYDLQPPGNPEH